jgi:hypothetical protein
MKYFTPELLSLGWSGDRRGLDEQETRWEEAGERYAQYLAQVRDGFPKGLRRLFSRYYLHDSAVYRIGQNDRAFLIELQLDTPPHSLLTVRYRLLRPAEVNKESLLPAGRSQGTAVRWLYAEVERLTTEQVLDSATAATWVKEEWLAQADRSNGEIETTWPFWVHRVLLSNGWELTVPFHDLEVREYEPLLQGTAVNERVDSRLGSSTSA